MNIIKTNAMMRLKRELDDLNKNPIENLNYFIFNIKIEILIIIKKIKN